MEIKENFRISGEKERKLDWGPKAITSGGGRFGEDDVIVHYKEGEFRVNGKVVEKETFISALGPHRQRMEDLDPKLKELLEN